MKQSLALLDMLQGTAVASGFDSLPSSSKTSPDKTPDESLFHDDT